MEENSQNTQPVSQQAVEQKPPNNSGMSNDTKTIIVVLLLVFVYPVGIILVWAWTQWSKWVKWLVSLPLLLAVLGIVAGFVLIFLGSVSHMHH